MNLQEKKICRQNLLEGSTFSAFRKGQKITSKFEKHVEQKRCLV